MDFHREPYLEESILAGRNQEKQQRWSDASLSLSGYPEPLMVSTVMKKPDGEFGSIRFSDDQNGSYVSNTHVVVPPILSTSKAAVADRPSQMGIDAEQPPSASLLDNLEDDDVSEVHSEIGQNDLDQIDDQFSIFSAPEVHSDGDEDDQLDDSNTPKRNSFSYATGGGIGSSKEQNSNNSRYVTAETKLSGVTNNLMGMSSDHRSSSLRSVHSSDEDAQSFASGQGGLRASLLGISDSDQSFMSDRRSSFGGRGFLDRTPSIFVGNEPREDFISESEPHANPFGDDFAHEQGELHEEFPSTDFLKLDDEQLKQFVEEAEQENVAEHQFIEDDQMENADRSAADTSLWSVADETHRRVIPRNQPEKNESFMSSVSQKGYASGSFLTRGSAWQPSDSLTQDKENCNRPELFGRFVESPEPQEMVALIDRTNGSRQTANDSEADATLSSIASNDFETNTKTPKAALTTSTPNDKSALRSAKRPPQSESFMQSPLVLQTVAETVKAIASPVVIESPALVVSHPPLKVVQSAVHETPKRVSGESPPQSEQSRTVIRLDGGSRSNQTINISKLQPMSCVSTMSEKSTISSSSAPDKKFRLHTKKDLSVIELSSTNNFSFIYPMVNGGSLGITVDCIFDGPLSDYVVANPKRLTLGYSQRSFVTLSLAKPVDVLLTGRLTLKVLESNELFEVDIKAVPSAVVQPAQVVVNSNSRKILGESQQQNVSPARSSTIPSIQRIPATPMSFNRHSLPKCESVAASSPRSSTRSGGCENPLNKLLSNKRSLNFGCVDLKSGACQTVRLRNATKVEVLRVEVSIPQTESAYQVVGNSNFILIDPGEDFALSITFNPKSVDKFCSKLLLKVNNEPHTFAVRLNGFGGTCDVQVMYPDEISGRFSKLRVSADGQCHSGLIERSFRLRNVGLRDAFVCMKPVRDDVTSTDDLLVKPDRLVLKKNSFAQITVRIPVKSWDVGDVMANVALSYGEEVLRQELKRTRGSGLTDYLLPFVGEDSVPSENASANRCYVDEGLFGASIRQHSIVLVRKSTSLDPLNERTFASLSMDSTFFNNTVEGNMVAGPKPGADEATNVAFKMPIPPKHPKSVAKGPAQETVNRQGKLKAETDSLRFVPTVIGRKTFMKLKLINSSSEIKTVKMYLLEGAESFEVNHPSCVVKPLHYVSIPIHFAPKTAGVHSGQVFILGEDKDDKLLVPLRGEGLSSSSLVARN